MFKRSNIFILFFFVTASAQALDGATAIAKPVDYANSLNNDSEYQGVVIKSKLTGDIIDVENLENKNNQKTQDAKLIIDVKINGLDDKKLLKNAKAFLDIDDDKSVKSVSYAEYMAQNGIKQIQESLKPYGYYLSTVEVDIKRQTKHWTVTYNVSLGKPVHAGLVDIDIEGEGRRQKEYRKLVLDYPIKTGDILVQEKYKTFKGDAAKLSATFGYFDADFSRKKIVMGEDYQIADIAVTYDTGKRYAFGETTIKQDFLDDDVFSRFIDYKEGDPYASKSIADIQRDLYNSNYVNMVDISADPVKAEKKVPIEITLTPKKNKKHTFAIGYGTDTGARAKHDFDWRWVNRRGHQFKSGTFISENLQEVSGEYRIPAKSPATDYYKFFATFQNNRSGDVNSKLWGVGGAYRDRVGHLEREIGIKWQQEDFSVGNDSGDVGLLTPFVSLAYKNVDSPINITRGFLLKGEITGADESMLSDVTFLQAVAEAKAIRKFDNHRVKLSGGVGQTWVDDFHQLPADYRFFTGGDKTVRGYAFNSIGDYDSSGDNIGGDKMYYASAEYEYFFKESMAGAVFVDAGDAYSGDSTSTKIGVGVGFHYYSPIGPIRVDVGHGFDDDTGETVRLHLNIGPEF